MNLNPKNPPMAPPTTLTTIVTHSIVTLANVRINKARATPAPTPITVVPQTWANFEPIKAAPIPTKTEAIITPTNA